MQNFYKILKMVPFPFPNGQGIKDTYFVGPFDGAYPNGYISFPGYENVSM
jgi:hypothetical protein